MKFFSSKIIITGLFIQTCLSIGCSPNVATIILLPDTQYYAEKYPEILQSQTNWILENKDNIDFVIHQGDLTQNNNSEEWKLVQEAFCILDDKVPYVLGLGNHDMGSQPGLFADTRNTKMFNSYFPYKIMSKLPGFGGSFDLDKMDNAYYLFEIAGHKWMVLSLEFGPSNEVLDWANAMVAKYPKHTVIVNTHSYMYSDNTRQNQGDNWRPQAYGIGKLPTTTVNDGEQIWQKLVRKNENIRFVFSGHILNSGIGSLISINDAGNHVYQFLANYQSEVSGSKNGGNGYLRILKMNMKTNDLDIKTYSPYINKFKNSEGHQYSIHNVMINQ